MICINCKKTIEHSYGAAGLMGNYCKDCANKLGLTPDIMGNPPQTGGIIPKEDIKKLLNTPAQTIPPLQIGNPDNDRQLIRLLEQLNSLIGNYNALYGTVMQYRRFANDSANDRLNKMLENIEEAIAALCLRITEKQCILTIKE